MRFKNKNKIFKDYCSILKIKKNFIFDTLTKLNLYNYYNIPEINKIIFTVSLTSGLKSETDIKIINSLNILDTFLDKKSTISDFLNKYLKKSKSIIFVTKSTINSWFDIYILLFCLNKIILPNLKKKFIFFKFKLVKNGFIFYISDLSSLAEMSDDLKKEKINVKISFFYKNLINKEFINFFLNYFGFNFKKG